MDEAIERLKKEGVAVNWGDDFGGDEETALSEEFDGRLWCIDTRPRAKPST